MKIVEIYVITHFKDIKKVFEKEDDAKKYAKIWGQGYIISPYSVRKKNAIKDGLRYFVLDEPFIIN
jgi:hypothetical protein